MTSWYKFSADHGRVEQLQNTREVRRGNQAAPVTKGHFVSMPQEDNLVSSGPSYHTQVCKNPARARSRVTEIQVWERISSPWLISPTLLAPRSFRWCSAIWTLIADEGDFLSHESKTPPEGSLPEQAVIHPAPREGTGRGMYLIRDPRLCAVPSLPAELPRRRAWLFILAHSKLNLFLF